MSPLYVVLITIYCCGVVANLVLLPFAELFGSLLFSKRTPGWLQIIQVLFWPLFALSSILQSFFEKAASILRWLN